jgi:hypothetical protein
MDPDRTILHLVEKKMQAGGGGRPRPTPVQNYGVHTIKAQLRPWWACCNSIVLYITHVVLCGRVLCGRVVTV